MKTLSASISATELSRLLENQSCQLIDVREPVEHAESHVAGARLIPLGQLESRAAEIDPAKPVVVMCHAGKRGQAAMEKLQRLGFQDVGNLEGGILAWKAAGKSCAAGEKKVFPLMRQVQIVIGSFVLSGCLLTLFVDPRWIYLPMFFGTGLIFAGTTGFCGLAILMAKMPWNRVMSDCCSK
jgi:rhodanese-related sulfurtransferase